MTLRAVILGILGALFIAGFGYVDDQILRSTLMVGHFFPVIVFGGLVVLTIGVNPLLTRLRYTWFPLHPVIFLLWGSWAMWYTTHSFLLGWMIKTAVTKLGGGKTYHSVRKLMFGVIAGDLLGGLLFALISAVYALVTGLPPISYKTLPG